MAITIEELLHRRTDLSTFVVHLTKDAAAGSKAKDNLLSIVKTSTLRAGDPMGWAHVQANSTGGAPLASQRVVCFTETPLEHLYGMFADISDRNVHLQGYGVAFTKVTARRMGINPIWYVDMTRGRDWRLAHALDELRGEAEKVGLDVHPAGKLFPFIDGMGDWRASGGTIKEFWWEREWRHQGDLSFTLEDVALVIAPVEDHPELEPLVGRRLVDGKWGLERIIAKLAGVVDDEQSTPLAPR